MVTCTFARGLQRMKALGLPAMIAARLLGVSPAQFQNVVRGLSQLDGVRDAKFAEMTLKLQELQFAIRPFELPTTLDGLQSVLDKMEEHRITGVDARFRISELFGDE